MVRRGPQGERVEGFWASGFGVKGCRAKDSRYKRLGDRGLFEDKVLEVRG